jgi:hypothetical protein
MKDLFPTEAKKYEVLPLEASVAARIVAPRPNITAGRTEFVYTHPMTGLPQGNAPFLLNTSFNIKADIDVPQEGAEGMIATSGGLFAGWDIGSDTLTPVDDEDYSSPFTFTGKLTKVTIKLTVQNFPPMILKNYSRL